MGEPTAPGWYPDGDDGGRLRWFDGAGWTSHIVEPLAAATPEPALAPDLLPDAVPAVVPVGAPVEVDLAPMPVEPTPAPITFSVEPDLASALGGELLVPDADRLAPAPLPVARPREPVALAVLPPPSAPLPAPAAYAGAAAYSGAAAYPGATAVLAPPGASLPTGGPGSWEPPPASTRPVTGMVGDVLAPHRPGAVAVEPAAHGKARRPWSGWALTSLLFTALVPALLLVLARAGMLDASSPWVVVAVLAIPVAGVAAAGLGVAATRDGTSRGLVVSIGSAVAGLVVVALAGAGVAAPAVASARAGSVDVGVRTDLARTAMALETARATEGIYPKRGTLQVRLSDPATHLHVCYYRGPGKSAQYLVLGANPAGRRVLTYDSAQGKVLDRAAPLPPEVTLAALTCPAKTVSGPGR